MTSHWANCQHQIAARFELVPVDAPVANRGARTRNDTLRCAHHGFVFQRGDTLRLVLPGIAPRRS